MISRALDRKLRYYASECGEIQWVASFCNTKYFYVTIKIIYLLLKYGEKTVLVSYKLYHASSKIIHHASDFINNDCCKTKFIFFYYFFTSILSREDRSVVILLTVLSVLERSRKYMHNYLVLTIAFSRSARQWVMRSLLPREENAYGTFATLHMSF